MSLSILACLDFWQPKVYTCRVKVRQGLIQSSRSRFSYTKQLAGNKSKILKGQIKFNSSGDHYPKDFDVLKASAWQSWKELGGWKCVAAGAKWILNTSLHGVTLSNPFSMPLCLFLSLAFPLLFLLYPKRHAGGKWPPVSMVTNRLSNEVNSHKERGEG